ncbi:MAG TPA: hypothetical protein VFL83_12045 [Anaeromyxobacter sp.]|nr:hypothetical protein [Anaeromyxobacter sp.]
MKSTSSAAGLLAALLALAATPAGAAPGNGIRLGGSEGRLHPYLDVESRFDSNVYYAAPPPGGVVDVGYVGDLIVHIRPGFNLKVPGERVAVDLDANLDWAQYGGVQENASTDLSKLYGAASLGVTAYRRGTIGLELDDRFRRDPSTSTFVFSGAVISNKNDLSVRAPWRPGGGALVISPSFDWMLETFEPFNECAPGTPSPPASCDPDHLSNLGYNELRAGADARWRFLPRTSAVFAADWFSRVPNDTALATDVSGIEARAGLSGLVTPHLGATVKLGYANTLGSTAESYGTVLATLEGEWLASDSARIRVGWDHGFGMEPDPTYYLYTTDRIVLGARYALAGRYGARLDGYWERRGYAFVDGSPTADLLRIEPTIEAALSRWINLTVGYAYTSRASSFSDEPGYDYTKNEAWLRLVFTY